VSSVTTYAPPETQQPPTAIIHPNGGIFLFPTYDQQFVQRFKRLVPPRSRVFHERQKGYVVAAPYHRRALALAGEWWPDLVRHETNKPYDFMADDARLVLRRKAAV
jgi:hypothetical protein